MNGIGFWVVYAAFLIGLMYFVAIRPQNKEKKKMAELLASVAVGDTVKVKQVVGSMEAMKMNQPLPCPADGVVKEIKAEVGARVKAGEVIMVVE